MQYKRITDLPDSVRNSLPIHAQEIYKEAFNNAWKQYADPEDWRGGASREEVAHMVAWSAVKQMYEKRNGRWVRKKDEQRA